MQWYRRGLGLAVVLLLTALLVMGGAHSAMAVTSKSQNFEASEAEFGAGAALETCSGQYCAKATIGSLSPGESASSESTAAFGAIESDSEPLLEVIVDPGESNLGVLDMNKTASKTSIVRVRNYLSNGYTVQLIGTPPVYDSHTLKTPNTPTASAVGTEQFGINVAHNTTPTIGANPVYVPTSDMSFGEAAEGYNTPDLFQYKDGDVIALSEKESGRTDYTISMIINVAGSTPAGHYATDFSVLVVPVY